MDLACGIVGADFQLRHGLTVNLTARQLIESLEVERATFHDPVESKDGFLTSDDTLPNANLFQNFQSEFPEVFDLFPPLTHYLTLDYCLSRDYHRNTRYCPFAQIKPREDSWASGRDKTII